MFRHVPQRAQQRHDVPLDLIGQAIDDALALAPARHQTGHAQLLQVFRRIGEAEARALGEGLDIARPLGQLLDQFDPVLVGQRLGHLGECGPDRAGGGTA